MPRLPRMADIPLARGLRSVGIDETFLQISSLEHQLDEALLKKSSLDPAVRDLRGALRAAYLELIFRNFKLAKDRGVEQSMWKAIFYCRIEEFRRRIKKMSFAPGYATNESVDKIVQGYRAFLAEASKFYLDLNRKLMEVYGTQDEYLPILWDYLYQSHVYMGDLARYSERSRARLNYLRALTFKPNAGHPHNQLAVLPAGEHPELCAVYSYFRALLAESPFETAYKNLELAFQKNLHRMSTAGGFKFVGGSQEAQGGGGNESAAAGEAGEIVSSFCELFVSLQGMLFKKASLSHFGHVHNEVLRRLHAVLSNPAATAQLVSSDRDRKGCSLLLRVVVVLIGGVVRAIRPVAALSDDKLTPGTTTLRQLAMTSAFQLLARVVQQCGSFDADPAPFLSAYTVVIEWLDGSPEVVNASGASPGELAARETFWSEMSLVANLVRDLGLTMASNNRYPALPEDLELRGFIPVQQAHSRLDMPAILDPPPVLAPRVATSMRALRVLEATTTIAFGETCAGVRPPITVQGAEGEFRATRADDGMGGGATSSAFTAQRRARAAALAAAGMRPVPSLFGGGITPLLNLVAAQSAGGQLQGLVSPFAIDDLQALARGGAGGFQPQAIAAGVPGGVGVGAASAGPFQTAELWRGGAAPAGQAAVLQKALQRLGGLHGLVPALSGVVAETTQEIQALHGLLLEVAAQQQLQQQQAQQQLGTDGSDLLQLLQAARGGGARPPG